MPAQHMTAKNPKAKGPGKPGLLVASELEANRAFIAFMPVRPDMKMLASIDCWLAALPDSTAKARRLRQRSELYAACLRQDEDGIGDFTELLWRAQQMSAAKPVVRTGLKVRAPFTDANSLRTSSSQALQREWQARADAKWAMPQHTNKSAAAIARLIARDGESPDTIRRRIRKSS